MVLQLATCQYIGLVLRVGMWYCRYVRLPNDRDGFSPARLVLLTPDDAGGGMPLHYCLFTPELQWQSRGVFRGKQRILQGCVQGAGPLSRPATGGSAILAGTGGN